MPRSTIANRRTNAFDANISLRLITAAALSATTSTTGVFIPELLKHLYFKAVINANAYASHDGSNNWSIAVEASEQLSTGYVTVGTVPLTGTLREFDLPLSGDWIEQRVSNARFIRVTATRTGAPGNLTFGAYLTV